VPGRAALAVLVFLSASCSREKAVPLVPRIDVEEEAASSAAAPSAPGHAPAGAAASARILPESAVRGTPLRLSAPGFDPEDAGIEWLVGGEPVPGERSGSFSTESLAKGDSVQARVTVGEGALLSNVVTLRNAPPELRSVKLVPDPLRPGDSPGVEAAASDPDGDAVTFEYAWERNGAPAGSGIRMDGVLARGDAFSVTVTPFDGEVRGRSLTVRREFRNYLPSIEGVADAHMAGDLYTCRIVATDGDGDPLTYALAEGPAGMSMDASTGAIRWRVPPETPERVPVTVSVTDGQGGEATYRMFLTFRDGAPR
jgi:hypothetical protein